MRKKANRIDGGKAKRNSRTGGKAKAHTQKKSIGSAKKVLGQSRKGKHRLVNEKAKCHVKRIGAWVKIDDYEHARRKEYFSRRRERKLAKDRQREEEEELRGNLFGGSQLFPHQVVDILTASPPVTQERFCTNQWSVMRKALLTRVGEGRNILPVVDMSSSMAIALGTLASEITADHLKNRMLVYGNKGDPQMLQLDPKSTICEKLRKIDQLEGCRVRSATRYSVYQMSSLPLYFRLTLEWIFQVVRDSNVPLKDVPDLVYFGNTSNGMSLYRSSFLEFQKKMAQLGESRSDMRLSLLPNCRG